MARPNSSRRYSLQHRVLLALCALLLAVGAWFAIGIDESPEADGESARTMPVAVDARGSNARSDSESHSADLLRAAQTDYRFPESGRLRIDSGALPPGKRVTFGLALSADELGGQALEARVVSVEGRATDAIALPLAGDDAGAGIALDVDWLKSGTYLIQVRTKEKAALPLRRFVLEVQ